MFRLLALLIGYAIGSIQIAYFVGKIHGIDIREHGSKNAGMTNITRTVGKKWGAIVFVLDLLKGVGVFVLATVLFDGAAWFLPCRCAPLEYGEIETRVHILRNVLPGLYAGLGAVLGHCFPVWLKFRGGKGVATTLGLIIMLDPLVMAVSFAAGLAAVVITRYISLGSLVVTFLVPVLVYFFGLGLEAVRIMAGIAAIIWILHRENIRRLLAGEERKFLKKT